MVSTIRRVHPFTQSVGPFFKLPPISLLILRSYFAPYHQCPKLLLLFTMPDNESSYQPDTAEDSDTPLAQIKARETERLTRKASNLSLSKKTKQVEHAKPAFEADSVTIHLL